MSVKKQKTISNNLVIGLTVIVVGLAVVAFSAVGLVIAYGGGSPSAVFEGDCVDCNIEAQETPLGEVSFGNTGLTATGTPDLFGGFTSINISEELRFGDNDTRTKEGISEWLVVKDFVDATVTPVVFQNNYGEIVFIREMGLQVLGKATTTVRLAVTTSTANFIASDDETILDTDAGLASLMRTFGNAWGADDGNVATGTMLWLTEKPGTAISTGVLPIEWKPDEYILVYATSTGTAVNDNLGITDPDNTFDGELYLKLERVD